jgi:hypothetical protein
MELDLIHEELIAEENVNVNDLPESIRKKIKGFNLLNSRLNNNPENEKLFNTVQKTSISIADEIQNWLETDFEEEEEDDDKNPPAPASNNNGTPPAPAPAPAPAPVSKSDSQPNSVVSNSNNNDNTPKKFGNLVMEKKILSVLNSNGGRIDSKTLMNIILKEPTYPTQVVHNIVLKKVFLSSSYKLA